MKPFEFINRAFSYMRKLPKKKGNDIMKKLLTKMLAISLGIMTLASCGTQDAQKDKTVKVGVIQFADHPSLDNCRTGFIEGLKNGGYVEGQNLEIEFKSAQNDPAMNTQIAQTFAGSGKDLICGIATPSAQAAYAACSEKKIPVIFNAVSDPIAAGLAKCGKKIHKITTILEIYEHRICTRVFQKSY